MANARRDEEPCTICVYGPIEERDMERRIHREFVDMPGLKVTADQATRMWSPGRNLAVKVLDHLVDLNFLRFDKFNRYARHHWSEAAAP